MHYRVTTTTQFRRDLRLLGKRKIKPDRLEEIIRILSDGLEIPESKRKHTLRGGMYDGCFECHIAPDWLLIYLLAEERRELILIRTGSHSDLF